MHIPSKDEMIRAVRKSGCRNLNHLPLDEMSAEAIYTHLTIVKCPCLRHLLASKSHSDKSKEGDRKQED